MSAGRQVVSRSRACLAEKEPPFVSALPADRFCVYPHQHLGLLAATA